MAERKRIVTKPVIVERLEKEDWNALVRESALQILKNPGATLDIVNDVFVELYGRTFSPTLIRNLARASYTYAEIKKGVSAEYVRAWMTANHKGEIKTQLLSFTCLAIEEKDKWILNDILSLERESLEAEALKTIQKVIEKKVAYGELYKWREGRNQRNLVGGIAREVIEAFGFEHHIPGHIFVRICTEIESRLLVFDKEDRVKKEAEIKAAKEREEKLRAQRFKELEEVVERKKKEEAERQKKLWEKKQRKEARLKTILKLPRVKLSNGKLAFQVSSMDDVLLLSTNDFAVVGFRDVVFQRTLTGVKETRVTVASDVPAEVKVSSVVEADIPKTLEVLWLAGGKHGTIRAQIVPPVFEGNKSQMAKIADKFSAEKYFAFKNGDIFSVQEKTGDHLIAIGKYRIATDEEKKAAKSKKPATILSKGSGKKAPSNVIEISFDGAKSSMADAFRRVAKG